ncbi:MAG: hypothetical protein EOO89_13540 [Pedobacter sp.]|nr:MAG: hypothetical protein EOO89_13540 [Pedobacter sp.]
MRMRIDLSKFNIKLVCSILLVIAAFYNAGAQVVWENPTKEIYSFLSRQAQKGNIELYDHIQPYSRKEIAEKLAQLQGISDKLSPIEKSELKFYQQEYAEFNSDQTDASSFLKRDQNNRLRFLSVRKGNFLLNGDPSIVLEGISGTGRSIFKLANGLQFWGHASKNISFQAGFVDITERGDGLDSTRTFNAEPGIVRTSNPNLNSLNYSDFRGNITYSWNNGSISMGQDQLLHGYGENGRIILSDKAPAYPFIRLDYQPLKWLQFNYSHSWLQSGIIDSAATYNKGNTIYGNIREQYVQKFMASHSLNFFPVKGLTLSLGESVVYSDKLQIGYLFPLMFFKVYDQYASKYKITTGSNAQFFFQASSRNHIKNTHFYATLFIDEIRMAEVFNSAKSRNQIGFNIGGSITDLLPYLTIGAEYTRLNPFVYQNLVPAQNYTNQNYPLGDWMGANADRILGYIKFTPVAKLKTTLLFQNTRKGDPGSLFDQYFAEPQPKFLANYHVQNTQLQFKVSYEWLNNLYLNATLMHQRDKYAATLPDQTFNEVRFGVRLGL